MSTSMERILESYSGFVYRVSQYQNYINDPDIGDDYRSIAYDSLHKLNQRILKEIENRETLSKTELQFSREILDDNFIAEILNIHPGAFQINSDTATLPTQYQDSEQIDYLDKLISAQMKIQQVIERYGIN